MSTAIATALKKIVVTILSDEKGRHSFIVVVASVIAGLLGLALLPIAVLSGMGSANMSSVDLSSITINGDMFKQSQSADQQQKLDLFEKSGTDIASAMDHAGHKSKTIKAQLIYLTYLSEIQRFDFASYANLFSSTDNSMLIANINRNYGTTIDYNEFMKSYVWIMNTTVNEYMFTDGSTKNNIDLSAWAENAYESGWAYKIGCYGEIDKEDKYRSCDNAGLMLGYLNYNAVNKKFSGNVSNVKYTVKGTLDTMPKTVGIGLYDGTSLGVYVGNSQVVYCIESDQMVIKQNMNEHQWKKWVTFNDVSYPSKDNDTSKSDSSKS